MDDQTLASMCRQPVFFCTASDQKLARTAHRALQRRIYPDRDTYVCMIVRIPGQHWAAVQITITPFTTERYPGQTFLSSHLRYGACCPQSNNDVTRNVVTNTVQGVVNTFYQSLRWDYSLAQYCTSDDPPNAMSNPEQCILNARSNFQSYTIFDNQVNGEFETAMVQKTSTWLVAELNDLTDAKCSRALFTLSRVLSSLAKAESLWDHLNSTRLISSTTDWFVQYILACYIMMDSKIPKAMSRQSAHNLRGLAEVVNCIVNAMIPTYGIKAYAIYHAFAQKKALLSTVTRLSQKRRFSFALSVIKCLQDISLKDFADFTDASLFNPPQILCNLLNGRSEIVCHEIGLYQVNGRQRVIMCEIAELEQYIGSYLFGWLLKTKLRQSEKETQSGRYTNTVSLRLNPDPNSVEDIILEIRLCASVWEDMAQEIKTLEGLSRVLSPFLYKAVETSKKRADCSQTHNFGDAICMTRLETNVSSDFRLELWLGFASGFHFWKKAFPFIKT